MGIPAETPLLTFEEFERLPDEPGKCELLEGELVQLPPAKIKHARISRRLFNRLQSAIEAAHARGEAVELGEVCIETGYHLDSLSWLQPDVSVAHPGQEEADYLQGAPAIAIEVISPANRARDVDLKTKLYFQFGALEVWQVYPSTRRVVVHTDTGAKIRVEHEQVTTPLLPGFALSIPEILPS